MIPAPARRTEGCIRKIFFVTVRSSPRSPSSTSTLRNKSGGSNYVEGSLFTYEVTDVLRKDVSKTDQSDILKNVATSQGSNKCISSGFL